MSEKEYIRINYESGYNIAPDGTEFLCSKEQKLIFKKHLEDSLNQCHPAPGAAPLAEDAPTDTSR